MHLEWDEALVSLLVSRHLSHSSFFGPAPAMPLPTHQVYRLLTKLNGFDSLWTFRIFDDNSLQVEIEREGGSPTQQALTTAPTVREVDQHVDNSYLTFDSGEYAVTRDQDQCECRFYLVSDVDLFSAQRTVCSLSPTLGVRCETNFDTVSSRGCIARTTFEGVDVALNHPAAWSVAVEPVRATLYPLSCGSYTLKGVLMSLDIRLHSPAILHIELRPNAEVTGTVTMFDSGIHANLTTVGLTGVWTMDSLEVFQDFFASQWRPRHLRLRLHGPVTQYGFQARWKYEEVDFVDDDNYDRGEEGFADLRVTSMRRHWTPDVHHLFPAHFHEAVLWCLLSSLRRGEFDDLWMPNDLWPSVFAFCDSQWFV